MNSRILHIGVAAVGFGLVASTAFISNPNLKLCVIIFGGVMSLTWDGWYLNGFGGGLYIVYTFAVAALMRDNYVLGMGFATSAWLVALSAKRFRHGDTFWVKARRRWDKPRTKTD